MLRGMAGDDVMQGAGGNDTLYGGDGNDFLMGGEGNDSLLGEAGNDLAVAFWGAVNGVGLGGMQGTLVATGGHDTATGGEGTDTVLVHGLQSEFVLTRLASDDYLLTSLTQTTESLRFSGSSKFRLACCPTQALVWYKPIPFVCPCLATTPSRQNPRPATPLSAWAT